MDNNTIFAAGFVFTVVKGIWYFLSVRDFRFTDLKAAGGMGLKGEAPSVVLKRELMQELGIMPVKFIPIYDCPKGTSHHQYFFLVTEAEHLPLLEETRVLEEKRGDKAGDKLEMKWSPLEEFAKRLYQGQAPAFARVLNYMAGQDRDFCLKYYRIVEEFAPYVE